MKKNLLKFIIVLLGIIAVYIYFFKDKFSAYNLEKSKKYCEEQVRKQKENY